MQWHRELCRARGAGSEGDLEIPACAGPKSPCEERLWGVLFFRHI